MSRFFKFILLFNNFVSIFSDESNGVYTEYGLPARSFMFWPNATVPFYINPDHFDHEQALVIMTTLSTFAFKTCLKFAPVMAAPEDSEHVMVFENPEAIRRCKIVTSGHSSYGPHSVILGYECLKSPQIEMIIMKALGFPFEHNRASRDIYVEVLPENIEPGTMELFTKESLLPLDLRLLHYDVNSVMHFGERDFSKNGHRTIIFKNPQTKQSRKGLTATDLRKIEIVYGPECRKRDRQEKLELCQSYPGLVRRKREVTAGLKSLRVNPDISPQLGAVNVTITSPHEANNETLPEKIDAGNTDSFKVLGIDEEVQVIVEHVHKISNLALTNARQLYCNASTTETKNDSQTVTEDKKKNATDLLGVIEVIADYAKSVVDHAVSNLTIFCDTSEDFEKYQRQRACNFNSNSDRCPRFYVSTKSWLTNYYTNYKNLYLPTRHNSKTRDTRFQGYNRMMGDDNSFVTDTTTEVIRKKRDLIDIQHSKTSQINKDETPKVTQDSGNQKENTPKGSTEGKKSSIEKKDSGNVKESPKTKVDTDLNISKTETVDSKTSNKNIKFTPTGTQDSKQQKDMTPKSGAKSLIAVHDVAWDDSSNITENPTEKDINVNITRKEAVSKPTTARSKFPTEKGRRKRDSVDKKPEVVVGNSNVTVEDKRVTEDISNSSKDDNTTTTKSEFTKVPYGEQQVFQGRRFRNKNPKSKENDEVEWDESSLSMEKTHHKKEYRHKITEDHEKKIKVRELVKTKMKEERMEMKAKQRINKKQKLRNVLPRTVALTKLNTEFYNERKWPGGEVTYVLEENPIYDLDNVRRRLRAVNDILKRRTCVKLKELTEDEATDYIDYLYLDSSPDYVTGRVGGRQNFGAVELFRGGQHRQHAAMVAMAMLGFYFEVARHDRDKYIRVHNRHIRPDKLHHFEKIREEATLDIPYDYQSATHPAWQFWRKIGKTGISTVATFKENDPDGSIMKMLGQNEDLLSELDIVKINSVYGVKCFQNTRHNRNKNVEK